MRKSLVTAQVVPWAMPIVERAVGRARDHAEDVEKRETKRQLALLGEPFPQSKIIAGAQSHFRRSSSFREQLNSSSVYLEPRQLGEFFGISLEEEGG